MLSEMELFKIKFYFMDKWDSIVGFFESLKFMLQHIYFLWTSKSNRIWDSSYLIDLIEYRLIKLRNCIIEEYGDTMGSWDPLDIEGYKLVKEDRESRIKSISECLSQLEVYRNVDLELPQPEFVRKFYEVYGNIFNIEDKLTKEQKKEYSKYIKDSFKLEKKSLKNFFKIMGDNIENWWV